MEARTQSSAVGTEKTTPAGVRTHYGGLVA